MAKREPNTVTRTPSGIRIEYFDSIGVDGEPQQRRYLCDGNRLPSVTTITGILDKSNALIPWAVKLAHQGIDWREARDSAGERGTSTHDLIVRMMAEGRGGRLSELEDEHRPYGQAAARWLLDRSPKLLDAERMVCTDQYAGRFDLLAEIDGTPTRVDFKTVSQFAYKRKGGEPTDVKLPPYPENALQIIAYETASRFAGYQSADALLIVRLGPDATYDETQVAYDPDRFSAILAAYEAKRATERDLRAAA